MDFILSRLDSEIDKVRICQRFELNILMGVGNFSLICERANIPLCSLVGPYVQGSSEAWKGLESHCYARSINLANTMVFNVGNAFLQFGTLLVVSLSIYSAYQKYTAVGRREILDWFYLFFILTFWSLVVDTGVVPASSTSFPYFVAIQAGLSSSCCFLLMLNSLLGYQLLEDGSFGSVWGLRLSSGLWGVTVFIISIFTFKGWTDVLNPQKTMALLVSLYIINAVWIFLYAISMFYLTGVILKQWWACGSVALGVFFFGAGQTLMYAFGHVICDKVRHYIDGVFFATVCNLFAFLMVYKSWDIITTEDLEFSVSNQENTWDLKSADATSEYALSSYNIPTVS